MPDPPISYKRLKKILRSFGLYIDESAGKGSEAVIVRESPRRVHTIGKHGKNPEIPRHVIAQIRRKFGLKPSDGVSDDDFYGRGWTYDECRG